MVQIYQCVGLVQVVIKNYEVLNMHIPYLVLFVYLLFFPVNLD